ncbi:gamma-glutamyl-gamma-aminobutyrate hydrolase family protein [Solicola sp. PLA-1-18]|uniref:gamma-glutamyl-gamma-aminobutyrate hydrolase family protein n=1 Tax=Solicola sp. PLA-1-18 TaxID=3380532 RepID=UPI003B7C7CFC
MAPLVGLTTYREDATWGVWSGVPADLLPADYADGVAAAGGLPMLLPPADVALAEGVVARLDALVVTGGADVDPSRYGAEPHERTAAWRPDRDAWELALLDAAASRGIPVLGVCRGLQVMAVHAGGTLDQHTPDVVGHDAHSPGRDEYGEVAVSTYAGTLVAAAVGDVADVRCHHHQSVDTHPGLTVSAHADDGTVEALEDPSRDFWVGVQWHPETERGGTGAALFGALVAAAG